MKSLLLAIIPCFLIAHAFSQVNLNQGLIGYFPFNGDANDRSGNGNNPTFNNGTLAPDRFGNANQAYWFDGATGGMTIPGAAGLNTATAMSIALYFNPETTNLATLIGKIGYTTGTGTQFQVAINWSTYPGVLFGVNNPVDDCNSQIVQNSSYVNTGGGPLVTNQWYCLAATFVNGVQKIYLNGALIQTTTAPFTTLKQCTNSDIQIGAWWANDQQRFKGTIDDVRIYNRALTQAEVSALCTACSNPTADFNFNQDACNALAVQFTPVGNNLLDPVWDFGDGNTVTGTLNPVHTYAGTGNYTVKLNVQNANCKDAVSKTVAVNSINVTPCHTCSNWLSLPGYQSYVDVGDLDIPGNVITVEAMINRTTPYSGGPLYAGDVVSKHIDPTDANYLLRPNSAEITTTNGYFKTPDICEIDLNKTYHVAMVYDGATLKFYRDGYLMSQVAATGNLIQNNWHTQIGLYDALTQNTQFAGYINEVRIWNVARSQAQIRQYMNASLPSPATQTGLQAYYTFDNLLNKQGNSAWNGTLGGAATFNGANPNCTYTADSCKVVVPQFTTPDTVCLNTPVTITNTTSGASTYYWNFCVADINTPPTAVNLGNPGNLNTNSVFMDYVFDNGNYYGFVVNYGNARLVRLDFGNSLLNTPTAVNLGNYGGMLQNSGSEGIQVVQNNGKWYALIVGGTPLSGTQPRIVKIDFGTSITSPGTATNWGNIGNMNQPIDLHVFKEGNNWYGFTVNAENNTITRFDFTNSFDNTPTAVNLGNPGNLLYPTGIYAINDNGFWRVFITNAGDNQRIGAQSSITRLDFGSSLLNTPTGVNLGNPGGMLHHPRDLTIMKFCGQIIGFAVNGNPGYNDVVRLNFNDDLTTAPTITSLGNIGNYNFPHSISRLFRVQDAVYAFIIDAANNTISRLRFSGCTNASVSSSTLQDPQPVTYSTPGTYNINLTIDDGLPTQGSYCKQVTVLPELTHTPTQAITLCAGNTIKIGTGVKNAKYMWNTGATTDSIIVNTAGTYWVQTDRSGCTNTDSMTVTVSSCMPVVAQFTAPDTVCVNTPVTITNTSSSNASSYYWTFCTGNLNTPPAGANLGVLNGSLTSPVYIDYVQDNGKYYGFMTDNYTGQLFRLEFGNSLLNTPVTYNLGDFGGIIPDAAEGIQVIKNEGKWYAIIVGGTLANNTAPRILKIEFGTNIANNTPVATNWGNLGNLAYPHDLYVFSDNNGVWYGLTVNSDNSTITRFNFTKSFSNIPTAVNLGNIGSLSGTTGIYAINDNGNWYAFVTNAVSSTITRLDFGNSLLNTPTGVNLGNIGGLFHGVWDIQVIKYCGELLAYVINSDQSYNNIIKLNFNNDITSTPTAVNFGNLGNMRFPHCLSRIFRAGADLYSFVPNVANQTLTRINFAGCSNASIPNSTDPNPAPITYNTPGTYNINLTIDDGLPTQTAFCKQVVVLPEPVHTPTQAIDICTGSNIKIGTGVKYAQYTWNTGAITDSIIVNTPGTYWVQTDRYGCSNKDSMEVKHADIADFYFKQDVCNPLSVQFFPVGDNLVNPYWSFGDGNTATGSLTASHTYSAYNNYTVKFGIGNGTCKDTITKNISINVTNSDLIYTPDTTICFNGMGQLRAYPALSFCWSPTTYLSNPNIPNPVTSTPGTMTYYYTAEVPGNNLINNGDFSNGYTGFSSSYKYTTPNIGEGEFFVGPNPQSWNALMGTCTDHTTGQGNMLLVNGATAANVVVWTEKINVTPNTNYAFSTWLQNINVNNAGSNPPQLQFSINGKNTGNILQGRNAMCVWDQFYTVWNSGNNTTATIAIVNQNTVASGNDYALDDISFAPVFIQRDSVKVTVDTPVVKTINDTTICKNSPVPLQAAGATTWSWSPAAGLTNTTISNPIATPVTGTQYIVTGTNTYGCTAKDTVQINLFPDPVVDLGPDITDCAINNLVLDAGNAGNTYLWQDGSTAQTFTANSFGKYYVQVTDANGCVNADTIVLSKSLNRLGDFTYKIDACNPLTVQFTGTGSNLTNPYWNYGDGNTTTGNLISSHTYTGYGDYTVQFGIESGYCKDTITHTIAVHLTPANLIFTTDTTICFNTGKQLQARSAQNFCWSPVTYLSDPTIPNPVSSTPQTITYYYTAEINGAMLYDSVTISVDTPIVKTNRDTTICKDGFVQLQSTGAAAWSWSPITGLSNTAIDNPVAAPTANTDYIVTGTTVNGCTAKDTVTIALYPVPAVISNHDITACPNTPVSLSANSALTSWSWSPPGTLNNPAIANPVATPGQNTSYHVQVTDVNNCSYTDSVNVQLLFTDFKVTAAGGSICKGESVNLKAAGGDSYLWSPAGSLDNAALSSPMATPDTSTLYSVHVTENTCNTDTTMNVRVMVNPIPTVAAEKANDLDCVTHSTQLNATGSPGNAYLWSPVSGLNHPNSPNPVSTTDTTITYVVAATNQFGCVALDSVTVLVTSTGKVSFEVPNAFTPNGDGRNDCLGVKSWGGVELQEFSVFNRWGQRVFSSTKTNPCWDGRFNGEPQPNGGYVYVIKAKTYCGPIKRTGTVILVR